jgi:hypothetical protein
MSEQRLSPQHNQASLNHLLRRNTMNASKLFTAVAAFAFAASAFAADAPAANAAANAATAAAAAQAAAAAHSVAAAANNAQVTRAQVRAEAADANNNRRATEASQFDWIMK